MLLDDTLGEHVGSLLASVDRQDHPGDAPYPLAPHPVTSHEVRGPVRVPVALRVSRRDAARPPWDTFVQTHCPRRPSPTTQPERARLQKAVAPMLLPKPAVEQLQTQLRTKLERGMALWEAAMPPKLPCRLLVLDSG